MYPLSIRVAIDIGSTCHRVAVAMEGYNGWARPLDGQILRHGYRLYSVNNLKLVRYKEIFPAPAQTDAIDARSILELFRLSDHLPMAKDALHEVAPTPVENDQLKRTTRRRKQLVWERVRVINRLQSDLHAVCPGLMAITGEADNIWFLNFLTCRDKLTKLAKLRRSSLLVIPGVGKTYAAQIQSWQAQAQFSPEVEWVGEMILQDAHRILALGKDIKAMDQTIAAIAAHSELAQTISILPGFGKTSMAEIAGEVGSLVRFKSEAGLAVCMGMSALDNSSGKKNSAKTPRHINTRAKAAMMVAVARHIACVPISRAYYDKKRAEGKHGFDVSCIEMGIVHRLSPPRHPQTNGMVELFNGRISGVIQQTRFTSSAELETTLTRYLNVYNNYIPQRALNHLTPIQSLKKWYTINPDLFVKRVYKQAGLDRYTPISATFPDALRYAAFRAVWCWVVSKSIRLSSSIASPDRLKMHAYYGMTVAG